MLVLSRHVDEVICIGDNIRIMVIEIRGGKVRLGIDAPRDMTVHRKEIYDTIKRESVADGGDQAGNDPGSLGGGGGKPSGCCKSPESGVHERCRKSEGVRDHRAIPGSGPAGSGGEGDTGDTDYD